MFQITEIPAAERHSWSKCKWYVIEEGREQHMTFVTRGQAAKYVAQREKVAAQEAAKAAAKAAEAAKRLAHPIGAAVETQRFEALERAGREFDAYVARVAQAIERTGGDLDVLAPAPNHRTDGRVTYRAKQAQRAAYADLCRRVDPNNRDRREIIALDDERVERARKLELDATSAAYDMFAAKLISKIGDCVSATVTGSLWSHSLLTVTKADGSSERWKTQQIVNCSVLGKLFNQWPSRLVK